MSKSILQSIKPQYCELIASGKKKIEVRKTSPKLDVPFKVYIYCTKGKLALLRDDKKYNFDYWDFAEFHQSNGMKVLGGKVIGEYVCDRIEAFSPSRSPYETDSTITKASCLSIVELIKYSNMDKPLYGWHISDLKIYDKPKELREFVKYDFALDYEEWEHYAIAGINRKEPDINDYRLTHPPQSWCYVEEV